MKLNKQERRAVRQLAAALHDHLTTSYGRIPAHILIGALACVDSLVEGATRIMALDMVEQGYGEDGVREELARLDVARKFGQNVAREEFKQAGRRMLTDAPTESAGPSEEHE